MPLGNWWSVYKWRFLPWVVAHLPAKSARVGSTSGDLLLSACNLRRQILEILTALDAALPLESQTAAWSKLRDSGSGGNAKKEFLRIRRAAIETFGFCLERRSSVVVDGEGVFVSDGGVRAGRVVCFYPGTVYLPGEAVLIQSIGNQFIFRCVDGVLIDGNDRRLSKLLFKLVFLFSNSSQLNFPAPIDVTSVQFVRPTRPTRALLSLRP